MTKGTFGENLRRERELRGVTLDEISGATRIATRFLEAIENEQWDQLPGGVFNRGFVRAVARYLGLDEESIVAEYTLVVGDRPSVPVWTGSPPAVTPEFPWLAWTISAVVIAALLVGAWFGTRRLLAWRAARQPALAVQVDAEPSAVSTNGGPRRAAADAAPSHSDSAPAATAAGDATTGPPPAAADSSAGAPATSPSADATSPAADTFELTVEADKKTKVTVVADANRVFAGTMKAGENRTFSAKDRFQVSAKDAGALSLEMNGKTLAPIGPSGHSGKVILTRDALKSAAGGGN